MEEQADGVWEPPCSSIGKKRPATEDLDQLRNSAKKSCDQAAGLFYGNGADTAYSNSALWSNFANPVLYETTEECFQRTREAVSSDALLHYPIDSTLWSPSFSSDVAAQIPIQDAAVYAYAPGSTATADDLPNFNTPADSVPYDLWACDDMDMELAQQAGLVTSETSSRPLYSSDTWQGSLQAPQPTDGVVPGIKAPDGESEMADWPSAPEDYSSPISTSRPYDPSPSNEESRISSNPSPKSLDIPRSDACFGVIVADVLSSFVPDDRNSMTPVEIRRSGNIFKLYLQDTNKYAGLLESPSLIKLLHDFTVETRASLTVPSSKINTSKQLKTKSPFVSRECSLRITIYGLKSEREAVGNFLSSADMCLQQPFASEYEAETEYCNPQYLVRPGGQLPVVEALSISLGCSDTRALEILNESEKGRIMKLFDCHTDIQAPGELIASPRLRSTLKNHQLIALFMMIWKESGIIDDGPFPSIWKSISPPREPAKYRHKITGKCEKIPTAVRAGVLADEMGLGKTLSVLSLICSSLDMLSEQKTQGQIRTPRATLIVTPKSTIPGWAQQIKRHVHDGQLQFMIYHGSNRQLLSSKLEGVDIVLTTFETLRSEWQSNSALYSATWFRLVLDEAHHIRNRSSQIYKAACAIHAQRRWCLTGTPVQNSLDDYGALLSFLGVPPFQDKSGFDLWIAKPFREAKKYSVRNLEDLIRSTCLRRTKRGLQDSCELPERAERTCEVNLHRIDQELYDFFKERCANLAKGEISKKSHLPQDKLYKEVNILSLINFLRLICDHGAQLLPRSALEAWEARDSQSINWQMMHRFRERTCIREADVEEADCLTSDVYEASPEHTICANCDLEFGDDSSEGTPIRCSNCSKLSSGSEDYGSSWPAPASIRPSAKVEALLKNLHDEQNGAAILETWPGRPTKSVVFSYWTKMLDLIQQALSNAGFGFTRIDGKASLENRRKAISRFNDDATCTVLLASIGSAGEGVDLTAANHVHLIEPQWNPMAEAQAVDRVHRLGQDRAVVITKYIIPDSIETYIQWRQQEKLKIIDQSINNSASASQAHIENYQWEKLRSSLSS